MKISIRVDAPKNLNGHHVEGGGGGGGRSFATNGQLGQDGAFGGGGV